MKRHLPTALFSLALLSLAGPVQAKHPPDFSAAKKLARRVHEGHQTSFYCGCDYRYTGNKGVPDFSTCGYKPRKPLTRRGERNSRIDRIEWEHVVPAWAFGHQLQCWQEGGRRNCKGVERFRVMESDLHNLQPALGEVNGDRGNFRFAVLARQLQRHGSCPVKVDFNGKRFEPPAAVRGDIARTYFYMRDRYGLSVSRQQTQLFEAWARQDPVDAWERQRERRIREAQGNGNSYVSGQGRVDRAPGFGRRGGGAGGSEDGGQGGGPSRTCDPQKTKCSQMASCAEARFYLNQCGRTRMDGNKDGVPCERLCSRR